MLNYRIELEKNKTLFVAFCGALYKLLQLNNIEFLYSDFTVQRIALIRKFWN